MEMQSVVSSMIDSIGHEGKTLRVRFKNGAEYEYDGVSIDLFTELLNAKSVGKYFIQTIKSNHHHTRI